MIEYIFFDATLRDKFVSYVQQHGVSCNAIDDTMGMVVELPEDIADDLENIRCLGRPEQVTPNGAAQVADWLMQRLSHSGD